MTRDALEKTSYEFTVTSTNHHKEIENFMLLLDEKNAIIKELRV